MSSTLMNKSFQYVPLRPHKCHVLQSMRDATRIENFGYDSGPHLNKRSGMASPDDLQTASPAPPFDDFDWRKVNVVLDDFVPVGMLLRIMGALHDAKCVNQRQYSIFSASSVSVGSRMKTRRDELDRTPREVRGPCSRLHRSP